MTLVLGWIGRVVALLTSAAILLVGAAGIASAHPLSTSAVRLDVGTRQVTATVDLPLDELSAAFDEQLTPATSVDAEHLPGLRDYLQAHLSATDASARRWTTTVTGGRVEQVDGTDNLVLHATLVPATGAVGDFVLHDDAVVERLPAHRVFVSGRYGHTGDYTTLAMLSWQTGSVPVASNTSASPPASRGFLAAVHLGVEHITSGSDHLLFLLMLLLPAPLLARRRRWVRRDDLTRSGQRVVHVVTAFAVGHSITLALGALGWVDLPTRLVESGIALSVLVSAVHALRPLVRRGEVLIAAGFGLLHGLAFATLLGQLDLSRGGLVTTLLGFNLGIELTQLLVVALVMPSLLVLSRTAAYTVVRVGLAGTGAILAAAWLAERTGLARTDPLEPVADLLVDHPLVLAAGLALTAVVCHRLDRSVRLSSAPDAQAVPRPARGTSQDRRSGSPHVLPHDDLENPCPTHETSLTTR